MTKLTYHILPRFYRKLLDNSSTSLYNKTILAIAPILLVLLSVNAIWVYYYHDLSNPLCNSQHANTITLIMYIFEFVNLISFFPHLIDFDGVLNTLRHKWGFSASFLFDDHYHEQFFQLIPAIRGIALLGFASIAYLSFYWHISAATELHFNNKPPQCFTDTHTALKWNMIMHVVGCILILLGVFLYVEDQKASNSQVDSYKFD